MSGTAFSIALVIALTGNTLINYSFGRVAEKFSISYLPLFIIACIACMLVLLLIIRKKITGKVKL
jgi:hypothetical protein